MRTDSSAATPRRLGLIVNPVAGMGGRVGLKGTDGPAALRRAVELGATPAAGPRAGRALARLSTCRDGVRVLAAAGAMGADVAVSQRFRTDVVTPLPDGPTGPEHTRAAARELERRGVDLLLFAGGDGTTRDIHDAIGTRLPVVGIPTGVKMHSGVFAASPESAGEAARAYLGDPSALPLGEAEVVDVDEETVRADRSATRLHGRVLVPADPQRMLAAKAASPAAGDAAVDALCREVAAELEPGRLHLLGPGTTTARVLSHAGLAGTLLGVDAVRDGRLVGADLGERAILELLDGSPATLYVGVVGGQGMLLGRGNQQISADVLRRVGLDHVVVLAGMDKLCRLSPCTLRVDTGDGAVDRLLCGHRRVRVAPGRSVVVEVST